MNAADAAGLVQAHEGLEHLLAQRGRHAGPVVVHVHHEPARLVVGVDRDVVAVARRVRHQIEEKPPERVRPHRDHRIADHLGIGLH